MIDTGSYMVAAYCVATAIYIGYSVSLWMRARRYRQQLEQDREDHREG